MPQRFDFKSIDPLIHAPARMAIMAILTSAEEAEYTFLSEQLGLTDGNLTTHLKKLEESGYVRYAKGFVGRKPRTTYRVTAKGRAAFERYIDGLEAVVRQSRKVSRLTLMATQGKAGPPRVIVVMGVEGSGKTTVGVLLAQAIGWDFRDADEFHSAQAKAKMAAGVALTDSDRRPWLEALRVLILDHLHRGGRLVLACSALKASYRDALRVDSEAVAFVYLRGDIELIRERLRKRPGHFAGTNLLDSQFQTLEEPDDAVVVDIANVPERIVASIRAALGL